MAERMRIAVAREYGPPKGIRLEEIRPAPMPEGAVRVAVRASGQKPLDGRRRAGLVPGQLPPLTFGWEFSGVVQASSDPAWPVGTEVIGLDGPGASADLIDTTGDRLLARPTELDWLTAGAFQENGQRATGLLDAINLPPGSLVVVHAAAGGIGSALVQLARARGLDVIGTAGIANQNFLRSLGVRPVRHSWDADERVFAAAARRHIDGSIDLAGTHESGKVGLEVQAGGGRAITLLPSTSASHGIQLVRTMPNPRETPRLLEAIRSGAYKPVVTPLPFTRIDEAHRRMDAKHARGRIVLDLSDNPFLPSHMRTPRDNPAERGPGV